MASSAPLWHTKPGGVGNVAVAAGTTRAAQKRADRRAQILRVAIAVFAERGYHRTSIDDIIAGADIARGTFYLYFASKAAVFESVLDDALQSLTQSIRPVEVEDPFAPPPHVQLRDNVARVLSYLIADRARAKVLLARSVGHEVEAAERLDRFYEGVRLLLQKALEHGVSMGLVRPCNPSMVAAGLLGMVRGMLERTVFASASPGADLHAIADETVDSILDLGLKGIIRPT